MYASGTTTGSTSRSKTNVRDGILPHVTVRWHEFGTAGCVRKAVHSRLGCATSSVLVSKSLGGVHEVGWNANGSKTYESIFSAQLQQGMYCHWGGGIHPDGVQQTHQRCYRYIMHVVVDGATSKLVTSNHVPNEHYDIRPPSNPPSSLI